MTRAILLSAAIALLISMCDPAVKETSTGAPAAASPDEKSVPGFSKASSSKSSEQSYENFNSPVDVLASYFNAVNRREYRRAYGYWGTPPGDYEEFARGYADTASVQLIVEPPVSIEGAAGSLYVEVPVVLVAHHNDGGEQMFSGCYTMRKSNLHPPDIPKEDVWHIYKANVTPVSGDVKIPQLLAQGCHD